MFSLQCNFRFHKHVSLQNIPHQVYDIIKADLTSQHSAHTRMHARTHTHTRTRTRTHRHRHRHTHACTHARAHAHTHTHTHTNRCWLQCFTVSVVGFFFFTIFQTFIKICCMVSILNIYISY